MQIGFIGIGTMGLAMANHIQQHGHSVVAYDLSAEARKAGIDSGLQCVDELHKLVSGTDVFLIMVTTDEQTAQVVHSLLELGIASDSTIVVAATNHPVTMKELSQRCKASSVGFVDAPVCYGLQGAKHGNLISLCGGEEPVVERITPLLLCYSRSVEHVGGSGAGQIAKTCNNMMHWAACVANFETLALAKSYGIDAQKMRETLLKCPARNTTLERWDTTRFTWHEKDMDVALALSQEAQLSLPLFGLVDQLVKNLSPSKVHDLLYENQTEYLGQIVESLDNKLASESH